MGELQLVCKMNNKNKIKYIKNKIYIIKCTTEANKTSALVSNNTGLNPVF